MSRIRPALIGSQHTRVIVPDVYWNTVNEATPNSHAGVINSRTGYLNFVEYFNPTVWGASKGSRQYVHFFAPQSKAIIFAKLSLNVVNRFTGGGDAMASSGRVKLKGLTTDWDPLAITWNTQTAPVADDPYIDLYYDTVNNSTFTVTDNLAPYQSRGVLDCQGKTIYGLMMEGEAIGPNPDGMSIITGQSEISIAQCVPLLVPVASRHSSGTTRTLVTTDPHNMVVGMLFDVFGVSADYDCEADNNVLRLRQTDRFVVATVPDAHTITYTAVDALTEGSTSSTGNISIY